MRTRAVLVVVTVALLLASFCLPTGAQAADFSFRQIDWLDNHGGYTSQRSDWGLASVQFTSGDAAMMHRDGSAYYGYLNIVTDVEGGATSNWAVQNKLLRFDDLATMDGRLADSMNFDLGVTPGTTQVTSLNYLFTIDSDPLAAMPTGTMSASSVGASQWLFGGVDNSDGNPPYFGNTGQAAPSKAQNYQGSSVGSSAGSKGKIKCDEKDIPAVDEEQQGCGPGSVARSLAYLKKTNPNLNLPKSAQDMCDDLYSEMNSDIGPNGKGTKPRDLLNGKNSYVKDPRIVSGWQPDVKKVVKALSEGADVEVFIDRGKGADGKALGGHYAFVSEMNTSVDSSGKLTGLEIKVLQDNTQGDQTAANDSVWLKVGSDGKIQGLNDGRLIDFMVETVVPEPSSLLTLGSGLLGMAGLGLRRRRG